MDLLIILLRERDISFSVISEAKVSLTEFIKLCQDAVTEQGAGRLSKDEKVGL